MSYNKICLFIVIFLLYKKNQKENKRKKLKRCSDRYIVTKDKQNITKCISYLSPKKIYYFDKSTIKSYWHDIRYKEGFLYNFVCEIPKMTKKKMEMSKYYNNPIVQDKEKNGKLRYYSQPIYWNYGFIPQTWENPNLLIQNYGGDNDPIDIVEIGKRKLEIGKIYKIKVLGCIGLIDKDEIDWKIIAINNKDINFDTYNNIYDVPEYIKSGIREWFRWYKLFKYNILNKFLNEGTFLDAKESDSIIEKCHIEWEKKYKSKKK